MRERSQSKKLEPRVLRTRRWWLQLSQRPALGATAQVWLTSLCIVKGWEPVGALGFLDPYRRKLIVSLVPAWLAMAMTVAIQALIGEAVDAIENGDRDSLV